MKLMKTFVTLLSAAAVLCGSMPCSVSAASSCPGAAGAAVLEDYWDEPTEAPTYPPATIEISEWELYLAPGETYQLKYYYTYYPYFDSDNPDIVSVDSQGVVTVSTDVTEFTKVTITGSVSGVVGNCDSDEVYVYVVPERPEIVVEKTPSELHPGETYQLNYYIWNPADVPCDLTFKSSDSSILCVDNFGLITVPADSPGGRADIWISLGAVAQDATVRVNVVLPPPPTEAFQVSPGNIELSMGNIQKITANRDNVFYTILDENVAHMVKDFVIADAPGSTWLIVESADGETCSVPVTVLAGEIIQGDVDLDGSLTVVDVVLMQRAILNLDKLRCFPAADMDKNGIVNVFDLILIKRAVLA